MAPPIVQGFDKIILINDTIDASELFSATDPDGDAITQYEFEDEALASSGRFELNGVGQANGSTVTIGAGQLSNLIYVGGTSIGKEDVFVRVLANGQWSNRAKLTVFTVRSNVTAPIVNATNFTVVSPERVAASTFIDAYDPDGWPITSYRVRDRTVGAGKFFLNGVAQTEGETFEVSAADFPNLYYEGAPGFANETIDLWVHDGAQLSERQAITASTLANINRPVVFYKEIPVPVNDGLVLFPLLDWTDPDGNSIKKMWVRDASPQSFSSYIAVNGRQRDPQTWISVDAENFGNLEIVGASRRHSSPIFVRLFDGKHWSPIQRVQIKTVERPKLVTDDFLVEEQLNVLPLRDVFDNIGPGADPIGYEIVDGTSAITSGRFQTGTSIFAADQIHSLTAAEFNNTVFRTGSFGARQIDDIYVRADNGTFKNIWQRVEVATEPNYDELLLQRDGPNFNDWDQWNVLGGADPRVITYSFMQTRDYDPGVEILEPDLETAGFAQFTNLQRVATRSILADIESFANVQFVEVADNDFDGFGRKGGLIRLGNYLAGLPVNITATPAHTVDFQPGGDVWINAGAVDLRFLNPGTTQYYQMMNQISIAMGVVSPSAFPNQQNWSNFTVQSSPVSRFFVHGGFEVPTNYSEYDIHGFQKLYGTNFNGRNGNDLYDIAGWKNGQQDTIATIWDGDGVDTLSAVGALNPAQIDLREGQFSTIGTIPENVAIAFKSQIENAIGSDGDDTIVGNQYVNRLEGGLGNDSIRSGSGDDLMIGGAGDDTFHYHIADGNDSIDDMRLEGNDTLALDAFPTLDSFSGDLAFRKNGIGKRDLIVDLVLDGAESQGSVTLVTQRWSRSRIETLAMPDGTRIDLVNLYEQATTTNQHFELTGTASANGFLVQPVI